MSFRKRVRNYEGGNEGRSSMTASMGFGIPKLNLTFNFKLKLKWLEGLAPYGGLLWRAGVLWPPGRALVALKFKSKFKFRMLHSPPSSSCSGLVAFSHLIGALQAPWLVKFWVKGTFGHFKETIQKLRKNIVGHHPNLGIVFQCHFVHKILLGGQNDHLKKHCGLWPPKKTPAKKWRKAKLLTIKL